MSELLEYGDDAVLYVGDVLKSLRAMPDGIVQCCVTSPPYWGLRDYGVEGQLGLEPTPEQYVAKMVEVFREVRRVLREDGTLWLNLGDSYAGSWGDSGHRPERDGIEGHQREKHTEFFNRQGHPQGPKPVTASVRGLKPKDLIGIPWRVALALQADGWWLRQDIIWHKPNPMPESVTDRCTKSHEYIFLLTKSASYFYDAEAIKEPAVCSNKRGPAEHPDQISTNGNDGLCRRPVTGTRNKRDVWTIIPKAYKGAHFAVFPPEIPELCIKAGTSERGCCVTCGKPWKRMVEKTVIRRDRPNEHVKYDGNNTNGQPDQTRAGVDVKTLGFRPSCGCGTDTEPCVVLDPFVGSGTTMAVARSLGRRSIGCELNPEYVKLIAERLEKTPHA